MPKHVKPTDHKFQFWVSRGCLRHTCCIATCGSRNLEDFYFAASLSGTVSESRRWMIWTPPQARQPANYAMRVDTVSRAMCNSRNVQRNSYVSNITTLSCEFNLQAPRTGHYAMIQDAASQLTIDFSKLRTTQNKIRTLWSKFTNTHNTNRWKHNRPRSKTKRGGNRNHKVTWMLKEHLLLFQPVASTNLNKLFFKAHFSSAISESRSYMIFDPQRDTPPTYYATRVKPVSRGMGNWTNV